MEKGLSGVARRVKCKRSHQQEESKCQSFMVAIN